MSNLVLQSNLKSPLVLTATEPAKVELKNYELPKSTGVLVPNWILNSQQNTVSADASLIGTTINVPLTRMGKLQMVWVRVEYKFTDANALTNGSSDALMGPIGLRMCDVEVWNFSGMLYKQDADKLLGQVNALPLNQKMAIMQRAMVLDNTTEEPTTDGVAVKDTDYCSYFPILLPSYFSTRMNWDLEVLEPLIIKCKFNSRKNLGLIAAADLVSLGNSKDIQVFTQTVDYEPEYKQALYLSNFGTEGLNMPYFSYDSETQMTTCTGATSTKVKLATTVPCFMNHIFVRLITPVVNDKPPNHNIKKIDVLLNNQTYIQNIPSKILTAKADFFGSCNVIINETFDIVMDKAPIRTIAWSDRPHDRSSFSGCLAYGGINLPEFELTYSSLTAANNEVVIVSEFYCELLMNGASGRIYKSISS